MVVLAAAPVCAPASAAPPTTPLTEPPAVGPATGGHLSPNQLFARFYRATLLATRAAGHRVSFNTGTDVDPPTAGAFADEADLVASAIVDLATRPGGARILASLTSVQISISAHPSVSVAGGEVRIAISPPAPAPAKAQVECAVTSKACGRPGRRG
ncbi:MAG TPA: DUF4908 domain-containing protein [Caulobacteraceae bacterium]|nr:DUF4908 domain-containing protein [Caulobacteraceae bacterium]